MSITAFHWLDHLGSIPKDGSRLLRSGKFSIPPQGDHLTGQSDIQGRWEMVLSVRSAAHCELHLILGSALTWGWEREPESTVVVYLAGFVYLQPVKV